MPLSRRHFLATAPLAGLAPARSLPRTLFRFPEVTGVVDSPGNVGIETTGARIVVHRSNPARIEIVQKINGPRDLCQIELDTSFADLTLDYRDSEQCVLYVPEKDEGFNLVVHGDSLLSLRAGRNVRCRMRGAWVPEYNYAEGGNLLFLDRRGGYGQYVLHSDQPFAGPLAAPSTGVSFSTSGWETHVQLPLRRTLLASVAPPREFDFASSVQDRVVHHFIERRRADRTWDYFPADSTIAEYARRGNILVLHIWQRGAGPFRGDQVSSDVEMYAKAAPWASRRNVPLDEAAFRRVISTARNLGMRVLPYLSPMSFPGTTAEFLRELERLLAAYPLDGFYFDGISPEVLEAYEIMKGARRVIGNQRLLYVHIPSPILGSVYSTGKYVYCPFIDTYANFILRAEHIDTFDEQVLRYTISGHNISNAIGYVCNYDYDLAFNRQLIRKVLDYQVRVPWWGGWDIYLESRGQRLGKKYPPEAPIHDLLVREYFPSLDALRP